MAVIYQSKGSGGAADARFDIDRGANPATSHEKSNFFYKHLRIMNPLPSRAEMETIVQGIRDDRNKSPASIVVNAMGESRRKDATYGKLKPDANTTLFVTTVGFEALNAYIEEYVTESGENWVPIPGGGVVVTRSKVNSGTGVITFKTEIFDSGYLEIKVEVGGAVQTKFGGYGTKVVYHFGGVAKSLQQIYEHH